MPGVERSKSFDGEPQGNNGSKSSYEQKATKGRSRSLDGGPEQKSNKKSGLERRPADISRMNFNDRERTSSRTSGDNRNPQGTERDNASDSKREETRLQIRGGRSNKNETDYAFTTPLTRRMRADAQQYEERVRELLKIPRI